MSVWDADLFGLVQPCAPMLKWPGGKSRLVDLIESKLTDGARFVEPFVGSAAVFLGMRRTFDSYLLCDANADAIGLFETIRDDLPGFLTACKVLFTDANNAPEGYANIRAWFNSRTADPVQQAAGFLWLNKHGFNGLVRYNKSGALNVPYGRPDQITFPLEQVKAFHDKSQRADFVAQDFRVTMADLGDGDVVYVDPPYSPLTETADFAGYTAGGFSAADHADLVTLCRQAALSGALVVLSEHDTPATRARFEGATISGLDVRRSMSADGSKRGMAAELLVVFDPVPQPTLALVA
jgi:DNA adenine methylase